MRELRIVSSAKNKHKAYYGDQLLIPDQPTEIALHQGLTKHEINLRSWEVIESYGNDFPYTWVWVHKSGDK